MTKQLFVALSIIMPSLVTQIALGAPANVDVCFDQSRSTFKTVEQLVLEGKVDHPYWNVTAAWQAGPGVAQKQLEESKNAPEPKTMSFAINKSAYVETQLKCDSETGAVSYFAAKPGTGCADLVAISGNTQGERVSTLWTWQDNRFAILADNQDMGYAIREYRERSELTLGDIKFTAGLIGAGKGGWFGDRNEMGSVLTMNANGTVQGPDIGYRLISGVNRSKRDNWFMQCHRTNF